MRAFTSDQFVLPLPDGHRFPMAKYRRLRERVERELPAVVLQPAPAADDDALCRAHDPAYVHQVAVGSLDRKAVRAIGFPWSPELVERSRRSVGATIAAARCALMDGTAANLAGGTHHAGPARGQGYCVFNDVAVGARAMQAEGRVQRVLVVDLDVHQGNGTAEIFANDPSVFTLSVHGAKNFPFHKAVSDLDVGLPDGTTDGDYLQAVDDALVQAVRQIDPQLVFYVSGADPYAADALGRLQISIEGMAARDRLVFSRIGDRPCAVSMAGGYCPDIDQIVTLHLQTLKIAAARL